MAVDSLPALQGNLLSGYIPSEFGLIGKLAFPALSYNSLSGTVPEQWRVIVDEVVDEIEAAVGDEPVNETTPLRADLALKSVVVFASATLLRFEAPRQFPDSWIHVQLDEALAFEDLAVDARDPDAQTVSFDTLDDLLDHISAEDPAQASPGSPQAGPAAQRKK